MFSNTHRPTVPIWKSEWWQQSVGDQQRRPAPLTNSRDIAHVWRELRDTQGTPIMGLLPNTQNYGCAGNAWKVFFPPQRVGDPDMHHGTCVTHVPRCMPGSLTNGFRGGENVPGIPCACATHNFAYLVRGPCAVIVCMSLHHNIKANMNMLKITTFTVLYKAFIYIIKGHLSVIWCHVSAVSDKDICNIAW